jgi:hypothetical protein
MWTAFWISAVYFGVMAILAKRNRDKGGWGL